MGNCASNKCSSGKSSRDEAAMEMVKKRLLADDEALRSSSSRAAVTEVKIKVTKRELEKLLSKADAEELPLTQLLSRLINVSDAFETHRRSWRPSLQSIPELVN